MHSRLGYAALGTDVLRSQLEMRRDGSPVLVAAGRECRVWAKGEDDSLAQRFALGPLPEANSLRVSENKHPCR
jgi:hypothetical protein